MHGKSIAENAYHPDEKIVMNMFPRQSPYLHIFQGIIYHCKASLTICMGFTVSRQLSERNGGSPNSPIRAREIWESQTVCACTELCSTACKVK